MLLVWCPILHVTSEEILSLIVNQGFEAEVLSGMKKKIVKETLKNRTCTAWMSVKIVKEMRSSWLMTWRLMADGHAEKDNATNYSATTVIDRDVYGRS